jgi:hypothetical protein
MQHAAFRFAIAWNGGGLTFIIALLLANCDENGSMP